MADFQTGGWLAGKKKYVYGAVAVMGVIAAYLVGDVGLTDSLKSLWTAISGTPVVTP